MKESGVPRDRDFGNVECRKNVRKNRMKANHKCSNKLTSSPEQEKMPEHTERYGKASDPVSK
jgi:hypothetical protein